MEKRVHLSLWSKALAAMRVVACNFIREISCVEIGSFKFSRSSHFFCVLQSRSECVKASGSKWVLNQALQAS